ncbi:hypothetical protein EDB85DRAFT_1898001 [Lactarius pseudohatsudake]|nr:hypothetical protein EDB85DRAFT_1898001 [Lactarius pseudohatsudake]
MPALSYSSNTLGNLTAKQAMSPRGVTQPTAFVLSCTLLSLHPTDSLDKVRELVRERATSLVSASRPREAPTPSAPVTTTPSHFPSQILPTSVNGAVFQDTKATATENRGPVLPSDIAKKAIEPPDDYQTPQTTILSNPESRVAPASVADTVNGPASNSPTSVCDLADSRAEASVLPTFSHSPIVSRSLSDLESSVFGLPSVPSPEQPQLRVTQAIESWPRWPQNRFIVPTSLHIARQLERVWHVFPRYFQFPLPSAGGVANCTPINVTLPPSVTVSITPDPPSVCEAVRTPVCVSVLPSSTYASLVGWPRVAPASFYAITSRPRWPQISLSVPKRRQLAKSVTMAAILSVPERRQLAKSVTMAAMGLKVGHDGRELGLASPSDPACVLAAPSGLRKFPMRSEVGHDGRKVFLFPPSPPLRGLRNQAMGHAEKIPARRSPRTCAEWQRFVCVSAHANPRTQRAKRAGNCFCPSSATQYLRWRQQLPYHSCSSPSSFLVSTFPPVPAQRAPRLALRVPPSHASVRVCPSDKSCSEDPGSKESTNPSRATTLRLLPDLRKPWTFPEGSDTGREDTQTIPTVPSRASAEDWGQSNFQWGGESGPSFGTFFALDGIGVTDFLLSRTAASLGLRAPRVHSDCVILKHSEPIRRFPSPSPSRSLHPAWQSPNSVSVTAHPRLTVPDATAIRATFAQAPAPRRRNRTDVSGYGQCLQVPHDIGDRLTAVTASIYKSRDDTYDNSAPASRRAAIKVIRTQSQRSTSAAALVRGSDQFQASTQLGADNTPSTRLACFGYQRETCVQAATLPKTEQRRIWEGKRVIITRGSLKGYRGLVKAEDLIGVQVELDAKVALHGQARQHFQFGEFGLEPIAMPVASPNPLNRTPPPEDVARAVTPDPEEPEESTVYPQSSPQGPEIQGAVREECIPFHVWGIPASSPHASLNGLAAKTVPVTSQKITPEPNEVNVSVVHKRKPTQVSINPSNLIPWIPSEGNKVVITGHRWNGQVGKLLKLERGSCTIKLESSGEIVHCAVEDVMNTRARISTNFSSQLLCASSLLTDGPTSFLTTCEMPKQPSSPLIHARGGRMSNRPYIPSPSPPVEDFQIEWRYHKDTHLILHDNDECKTCDTWSMHYFIHTTHGNDTFQEAQTARDSFRRELEEWRQELAALRREFQEVRQELKDTVASLRDDAQTPPRRRRKRVHRARTPSPTPSVVEVSPGPSYDIPATA